ncbi:TauD/TfdA family dioxygenase [Rhizobium sp. FKY42]|uniref:TauD/TfdA family dioxygenase n=1 Tax=Rhizobium sp. FKY42 TaxID=2562310 RepID=UPI0010C0BA12|nr:TauD/TfdA family dioxygenase [Rhizobium sp. FKY42]
MLDNFLSSIKADADRSLLQNGYFHLKNLHSDFPYLKLLESFGELADQYGKGQVWEVVSKKASAEAYNSQSVDPIGPHTECFEFQDEPPKYLALWCVRAPSCGGGKTLLADGLQIVSNLSAPSQITLTSEKLRFYSSAKKENGDPALEAIHATIEPSQRCDGERILRFSTKYSDARGLPWFTSFHEAVQAEFSKSHTSIEWSDNDLLIWDNHRMLHGRSAFEDNKRELKRVWIM